jgi:HK97 family phage portal protein
MSIGDRITAAWQGLTGKTATVTARFGEFIRGEARFVEPTYKVLAELGYTRNPIGYAALTRKGTAFGEIEFKVARDGEIIEDHPVAQLLRRPNPHQGKKEWREELNLHLDIDGNAYIQMIGMDNAKPEMRLIRPDWVEPVKGNPAAGEELVKGFKFDPPEGEERRFEPEEMLHIKRVSPLSFYDGASPIEAAVKVAATFQEGVAWNKAVLENKGSVSGILKYTGTANLDPEKRANLKAEIREKWEGSANAEQVKLLENDFEWTDLSKDAKDLDWLKGMQLYMRILSVVLKVPPELIADSKSKTFSNYRVAKEGFYRDTIVPEAEDWAGEIENWLHRHAEEFGKGDWGDIEVVVDTSNVTALQTDDTEEMATINSVEFLTPNEKREMFDLEPVDDPAADQLYGSARDIPLTGLAEGDPMPDEEA